ncbi:alginate O-acetyltransferase AlgX-related protein [Oceanimonas sp. CAM02]|uniref:alginate O-acetyltransferase AlgX-related protein n=1 Tax=Oceanimonas sp. CAM02 TaxID=3080336 RepID=UPI002936914E|nr:hypothetical protein [Oceanimonas sp. CAM02]MDV2858863.1 hypothetical protein [Oceanimonas sp. CAM02]
MKIAIKELAYSALKKIKLNHSHLVKRVLTTMLTKNNSNPVFKWHLDYPSKKYGSKKTNSGLVVQGWALLKESSHTPAYIIARWSPNFYLLNEINLKRSDVIKETKISTPKISKQMFCGFSFTIPHSAGKVELILKAGNNEQLLKTINTSQHNEKHETIKVLKGKNGWLFLDNDTNNSIDQFTGKIKLTEITLSRWSSYFHGMKELAKQHSSEYAMLIAPSKESVVGEKYHPQKKGVSPITEIEKLAPPLLVYPLKELKNLGDDSYLKCDTHWSHKGALTATLALMRKFGIASTSIQKHFKSDRYKVQVKGGDLGNKLTPRESSKTEILKSFNYRNFIVYDNALPNIGRIIAFHNKDSLIKKTCLTFGSSSSYSMFNYLSRIFENYLFIHTAGNIDPNLLKIVKPDYLVTQTNARFVIQAPSTDFCLLQAIREKITALSEDEIIKAIKNKVSCSQEKLEKMHLQGLDACLTEAFDKVVTNEK